MNETHGAKVISARRVELLCFCPTTLQCGLSTYSMWSFVLGAFVLWPFVRIRLIFAGRQRIAFYRRVGFKRLARKNFYASVSDPSPRQRSAE